MSRDAADPAPVEALLFDLGGVLIEIDFGRALAAWARTSGIPVHVLGARFAFDAAYEAHERGELAEAAYFAALRTRLQVRLSDAQLRKGWNAIFLREVAGVRELLAQAARHRPVYVFSNTNAVHADHWRGAYPGLLDTCREVFLSCEIGLRKPAPAAFRHVAERVGVAPQRIAFFDDVAENVAGARAAGLRATRTTSLAQLRAALDALPPAGRVR